MHCESLYLNYYRAPGSSGLSCFQGIPVICSADVRSMIFILFRKPSCFEKVFGKCIRSTTQDISINVFGHVFKVVHLGNALKSTGFRTCINQKKYSPTLQLIVNTQWVHKFGWILIIFFFNLYKWKYDWQHFTRADFLLGFPVLCDFPKTKIG